MLLLSAFLFFLVAVAHDPIDAAMESYSHVTSYQLTLKSTDSEIKYYYKKPGFVRMEFVSPHEGAVLVYNPFIKKVKLRPFRVLKFFVLTLSPDNRLVTSPTGHKVHEADIGVLLAEVKKLQLHGTSKMLREEAVGEKESVLFSIEGMEGFTVNNVYRYLLWLDKKTNLPVKVSSFSLTGQLIEEVIMSDLQINVEFSGELFKL